MNFPKEIAFDSLQFPACAKCNEHFSGLEGQVKAITVKMIKEEGLSRNEVHLFLDWLDKVRTGLWLGALYLGKNPFGIKPLFHISSRVGAKDRMMVIYRAPAGPRGVYAIGFTYMLRSLDQPSLLSECFDRFSIFEETRLSLPRSCVQAHVHDGYWEDVGTIGSYFEANMALTSARPPFSFWDAQKPIYTQPRFLPATKVHSCDITESLISEGSFIEKAHIERSVIGIRTRVADGAHIRHSLILGADVYESAQEIERSEREGTPPIGIGCGSVIENAIVDKNARVGRGVRILNEKEERERDATTQERGDSRRDRHLRFMAAPLTSVRCMVASTKPPCESRHRLHHP